MTVKTFEEFPGINNLIINQISTSTASIDNQSPHFNDTNSDSNTHSNGYPATPPTGHSVNTKVQVYQQKSTIASSSNVPLTESHICASSIVSTVNVTQNIKSQKKDNVTQITINRVYETDVKNNTFIVKSSQAQILPKQYASDIQSSVDRGFTDEDDVDYGVDQEVISYQSPELCDIQNVSVANPPYYTHSDSVSSQSVQSEPSHIVYNRENEVLRFEDEFCDLSNSSNQSVVSPFPGDLTCSTPLIPSKVEHGQVIKAIAQTPLSYPLPDDNYAGSKVLNGFPNFKLNLEEGTYQNIQTGQVLPISDSIQQNLLDFQIKTNDQDILLSDYIDEDNRIRLPNVSQALTLSQLLDSGLVDSNSCLVIDKQLDRQIMLTYVPHTGILPDQTYCINSPIEPPISYLTPTVIQPSLNFPISLTNFPEENNIVAQLTSTEVRYF